MADILKNEEINTMIYTIGAGVGADFSLMMPTMTKIIIKDRCGYGWCPHSDIALDFFYRYMRPLVEAGHVYIALPPSLQDVQRKRQERRSGLRLTDGEQKNSVSSLVKAQPPTI